MNKNENENNEDTEKFVKMEMQDVILDNKLIINSDDNNEINFSKIKENDINEVFLDYNQHQF